MADPARTLQPPALRPYDQKGANIKRSRTVYEFNKEEWPVVHPERAFDEAKIRGIGQNAGRDSGILSKRYGQRRATLPFDCSNFWLVLVVCQRGQICVDQPDKFLLKSRISKSSLPGGIVHYSRNRGGEYLRSKRGARTRTRNLVCRYQLGVKAPILFLKVVVNRSRDLPPRNVFQKGAMEGGVVGMCGNGPRYQTFDLFHAGCVSACEPQSGLS